MKYDHKGTEFETLDDGDVLITINASSSEPRRNKTAKVRASELSGLSFQQIVVLFCERLNEDEGE